VTLPPAAQVRDLRRSSSKLLHTLTSTMNCLKSDADSQSTA
jgi:hypothetical protein